ncbi:hypothetical protein ACFL4P_01995 [Gemmatimonadota bacterium]
MQKNMDYLSKLILVALMVCLAGPAYGIQTRNRLAQGNNLQLNITCTSSSVFNGTSMFPAGSGNIMPSFEGGWGHCLAVARDKDGDGVIDDTLYGGGRARSVMGMNSSLESYAQIEALYNAGERMTNAVSRVDVNRVWSSLDADDMADWPPEFREGRTAAGDPILHGAETIVTRFGDAFNTSFAQSKVPRGVSFEYRIHFLNFGESNNMAYGTLFIRNMSEYLKWNDTDGFVEQVAATPDGQNWNFVLCYFAQYFGIGSSAASMDEGWAMHPADKIVSVVDYDGMEAGFTNGGVAFNISHKMLRNCSLDDETMEMTALHVMRWGAEFGGPRGADIYGLSDAGLVYRASLGELYPNYEETAEQLYESQISPITGRVCWGWPGLPRPTDTYYDAWLWGRRGRAAYNTYGEITDFGPRDSTSCDWVIMAVYPDNPPMVLKQTDADNLYDPDIQVHMAPVNVYAEVAQVVYEGGYILPETPIPPPLTIVPGDRKVTITWSNINVNTPDAYYAFIQQHPEIDPGGAYREYDFEGYRLYRSFVGPSDSHSEVILDCSLSDDNLVFYYNDSYNLDQPYNRLRNGLRVWYALVPYDSNVDPSTGESFSLPELTSGKTWNRPRQGMYTVMSRSEASNFEPATVGDIAYIGPATVAESTAELAGDGTGALTEAPKWLEPPLDFSFEVINNERITQDIDVYIYCPSLEVGFGVDLCRKADRVVTLQLLDAGSNVMHTLPAFNSQTDQALVLMNTPDAEGIDYAIHVSYTNLGQNIYKHFDAGGYTGADNAVAFTRCEFSGKAPNIQGFIRAGRFEITWKSTGSDMSVDVVDLVQGITVDFSPYIDGKGWGFMPADTYQEYFDELEAGVIQADRTSLMLDKVAADNTDNFGIWINGLVWEISNITAMPAAGTKFTVTNCFGSWNEDMTVFTQNADPPYPDDKWQIGINAMTLDPEDADLTRIRAVPNPYLASSTLDLSPLSRRIEFVNLPDQCTIRIFTLGGNLVNVLNHIGTNRFGWGNYTDVDKIRQDNTAEVFTGYDNHGGTEPWNMRNRFGQVVASGLYFFHVTDSRGETETGKFYIIN